MLAVVDAVDPLITQNFDDSGLSPVPKLYTTSREVSDDEPVQMPHGWIYPGTESPGPMWFQLEEIVTLHLYGRSLGELDVLEDAVAFLDDHWAPNAGDAIAPYYKLQSKSRLPEGENVWHTTIFYSVTYTDLRKFQEVG